MLDFLNENLAKVCDGFAVRREVLVTWVCKEGGAGANFCFLQLPFANAA
jgi:hypothetical protein